MKGVRVILFFLLTVNNFQKVFFKNYFEWNKKGAIIKINECWGKTFVFDQITSIKMDKDVLQIKIYTGKIEKFDLKEIELESKIRLKEILSQQTRRFIEE